MLNLDVEMKMVINYLKLISGFACLNDWVYFGYFVAIIYFSLHFVVCFLQTQFPPIKRLKELTVSIFPVPL